MLSQRSSSTSLMTAALIGTEAGRPVGRGEEHAMELLDGVIGSRNDGGVRGPCSLRSVPEHVGDISSKSIGQCPAGVDGRRAHRVADR